MMPPFRPTRFPPCAMQVERRADGSLWITPRLPLQPFEPNLPAQLAAQARRTPAQACLAQRAPGPAPAPAPGGGGNAGGAWVRRSYADFHGDVQAVAQWLLDLRGAGASPLAGRPVLILSGNSIAHAAIKYGAMAAQMPGCPVSPNYALMPGSLGRLRHVVERLRPAVVFAEQAAAFRRALETLDLGDAVVVTDDPAALGRPAVALADVLATRVTPAVDRSVAALDPDAPSIYMLTSGSTGMPRVVVHTQRTIAANLAQGCQVMGDTAGWGRTMLDWLPWNHVSGAFTLLATLSSGGTLHVDAGRPAPALFDESIRNLKDIAPEFYINVPLGYALLVDALERDDELRERFFANLRLALYGGAGLPQALYERFQAQAVRTTGQRVFFTTAYGLTETAAGCMAIWFPSEEVGIGLPMPGLTLKLVPLAPEGSGSDPGRFDVRLRGPMISPGYLDDPAASAAAFDEDGFLRTGDAAELIDAEDVMRGLRFAGRLGEDFKLASGTRVQAGALRAALLEACAPLLADVVVCGENLGYVAVLGWPSPAAAALPAGQLAAELATRLGQFNAGRASSGRVERLRLLDEPPQAGAHEISDKGAVSPRVVLARRAGELGLLYATPAPPGTVLPDDAAVRRGA
jgi:feruloyl-CoA synthase